ncbi:hypothetical protein CYMTET_23511 [Cymbomonas tetramitiformis]|uniref:Integrase catalytic domain-containing protein n=1 Tax=Cymbomonas tetramitiformis TaxID=36881 RepID=A0AAE0FXS9_9CHLO|nr:hypothetical protein CYMTET_23511 [Cymbomonas tetramitiformis]
MFLQALRAEYRRCEYLRALKEELLGMQHHRTEYFRLVSDLIWRIAEGRYQVVLAPDSPLREIVMREAHEAPSAGHTGRDKTLDRVLGIDFVTGLPHTDRGVNAFVTITDKLSKMVHVTPMTYADSSAETVVRLYIDTVWRLHGAPMEIGYAADNQEDSDLWIAPAEYAINDSRSAATGFSPFELVHGHAPATQLDLFLEAALASALHLRGSAKRGTAHETARGFAEQLQTARASLRLAQQRMIEQFDSRHRSLRLSVGNRVWVDGRHLTIPGDRGLKPKLRKLRHGPLPIVECLYSDRQMELPQQDRGAPAAYRLELPAKWNMHDDFTADRLTPVVSGAGHFADRQAEAPPPPVMVEGQREVEVERILRTRTRKLGGKGGHVMDHIR